MIIPTEFRDLVRCFHQESVPQPFLEEKWIENQLKLLPPAKKIILRNYLEEVLNRDLPGVELRRMWEAGDPDFLFPNDEHLRVFFRMVRERL